MTEEHLRRDVDAAVAAARLAGWPPCPPPRTRSSCIPDARLSSAPI